MKSRIILAALISASAVAAVPSAASAAATCTFDSSTHEMKVRYGAADTRVTVRNGIGLEFREGTTGSFRKCFSATGTQASAANTNRVTILAASGTGAAKQITTIDETNGDFSASNNNLRFFVLTGTGDQLNVLEGSGAQFVSLGEQSGQLAFGPEVNLDSDNDADIEMTGSGHVVQVLGGTGNDILDAGLVRTYGVSLLGQGDKDTLRGGLKQDNLDGGTEDDRFFAKDGATDIVTGGTGFDTATLDNFELDRPTSIEKTL